jgi:hypothetical protein
VKFFFDCGERHRVSLRAHVERKKFARAARAATVDKNNDAQKTLDSCGFLRCVKNREEVDKFSHAECACAMNCDVFVRATLRERVGVAHRSLRRFGVFHWVL